MPTALESVCSLARSQRRVVVKLRVVAIGLVRARRLRTIAFAVA